MTNKMHSVTFHPDGAQTVSVDCVEVRPASATLAGAAQQSWELHLEQAAAIRELLDLHAPETKGNLQTRLAQVFALPVQPTIKQSLTVAEQSAELDAGMAAQHYCRGLWGAARGHSDWRKVHEHFASGYKQGRYDELQAQGPSPWPDDAPEVHYKRGYGVALSDAEEAIDDECRVCVVTASDCIELIRNLGSAPIALPVQPAPESKA